MERISSECRKRKSPSVEKKLSKETNDKWKRIVKTSKQLDAQETRVA